MTVNSPSFVSRMKVLSGPAGTTATWRLSATGASEDHPNSEVPSSLCLVAQVCPIATSGPWPPSLDPVVLSSSTTRSDAGNQNRGPKVQPERRDSRPSSTSSSE
jgi:hypothetical protein